jgi:hypothetical protein
MSVRAETEISASLASIIVGVTIRFFSDLRISHLSQLELMKGPRFNVQVSESAGPPVLGST